jgi:hypothetical protein
VSVGQSSRVSSAALSSGNSELLISQRGEGWSDRKLFNFRAYAVSVQLLNQGRLDW